jgi:hypothetical protein
MICRRSHLHAAAVFIVLTPAHGAHRFAFALLIGSMQLELLAIDMKGAAQEVSAGGRSLSFIIKLESEAQRSTFQFELILKSNFVIKWK